MCKLLWSVFKQKRGCGFPTLRAAVGHFGLSHLHVKTEDFEDQPDRPINPGAKQHNRRARPDHRRTAVQCPPFPSSPLALLSIPPSAPNLGQHFNRTGEMAWRQNDNTTPPASCVDQQTALSLSVVICPRRCVATSLAPQRWSTAVKSAYMSSVWLRCRMRRHQPVGGAGTDNTSSVRFETPPNVCACECVTHQNLFV